jgi:predicted DNA-binding WGR domain protein
MTDTDSSLVLAVSLDYSDTYSTSDKEYHLALYGNHVVARYGRRGHAGNITLTSSDSPEKGAAKFWSLLRAKTGKGYRVAYAMTFYGAQVPGISDLDPTDPAASSWLVRTSMDKIADTWVSVYSARTDIGARRVDPRVPVDAFREMSATPRTSRQGARLILALLDPHCSAETLMECALATEQERFLWNLAVTHPNCPDDVKAARALYSMSA